tara:strand:- start:257 stop:787 length:531 start_codon:yes stop_codon:yes gene_type:complete
MAIYYGDGTNSNGSSTGGRIVQCVTAAKNNHTNHTGNSWSTNVPSLNPSITLSDSNNKVLIIYAINVSAAANVYSAQVRLVRGSTALGTGGLGHSSQVAANNHFFTSYDAYSSYGFECLSNGYLDAPGSGTHSYGLQIRSGYSNFQIWVNRTYQNQSANNSGSASSYITLFEIAHT